MSGESRSARWTESERTLNRDTYERWMAASGSRAADDRGLTAHTELVDVPGGHRQTDVAGFGAAATSPAAVAFYRSLE